MKMVKLVQNQGSLYSVVLLLCMGINTALLLDDQAIHISPVVLHHKNHVAKRLRLLENEASQEFSEDEENNLIFATRTDTQTNSRQLCPSDSERFDPVTASCHDTGTQGPCGQLMVFVSNDDGDDRSLGHCECNRKKYDHPMVSIMGQCHLLYTQALCKPGQILLLDKKYGYPMCRRNPCGPSMGLFQGHCVKLNAPSVLCPGKNDVVTFKRDVDTGPVCSPTRRRRLFRRQITRTSELRCQEGYVRTIRGRCKRLLRITRN